MIMGSKHLHELLKEDQEPFVLKNYISDKRGQLKRPLVKSQIQVKKRKPISETSNFSKNICKNACFYAFSDSPELKKSPLFEFHSPAKSPCRSPNAIFLKIPARTAALLLEAALKIQKQSSASSKRKTQNKNSSFGLFGSILKKITNRNPNPHRDIDSDGVRIAVKDILRWDSLVGQRKFSNNIEKVAETNVDEMGVAGFCTDRPRSSIWSESNESISMDFEASTSTSSFYEELEEIDFISKSENSFCESPFHFVLQRSPSSGHRTPEFSSPATSPRRQNQEDNEQSLKKLQEEEEEEEKEQCSPVSVLDPPFEDDDEDGHDDDDVDDAFDIECSFAIVQRAKKQLLHKLRRFERLAELDPIELERRMLEDEDDYESEIDEEDEEERDCEDNKTTSLDRANNLDRFVHEVVNNSIFRDHTRRVPEDLKRLISDLITEEERQQENYNDREEVAKRVCKRLESWKEAESNTIDMMVEQDFTKEFEMWKKNKDQVEEAALQIELAIFGLLVEEFSEDI